MTDKSNAIHTAMDLLARGGNADFVEFSIDSDDQDDEELNKFTLEDYDDDDPLGIMVNDLTNKIQQTLDHVDDDDDENEEDKESNVVVNKNDRADDSLNSKPSLHDEGYHNVMTTNQSSPNRGEKGQDTNVTIQSQKEYRIMDNIPLDNEDNHQTTLDATPTGYGSTTPDSKQPDGSALLVSKSGDSGSALRKKTVAVEEDPLSAAMWTSSSVSGPSPISQQNRDSSNHVNHEADGTYHNNNRMMSGVGNLANQANQANNTLFFPPHSSIVQNVPYPRSNDVFVNPMTTTTTAVPNSMYPGNATNYSSAVDPNYNTSTKSSGVASFVSKTHALSSTLSSFASKFQDVVSNAANSAAMHGMNIHASAPPSSSSKVSLVYGHSSPSLSGSMRKGIVASGSNIGISGSGSVGNGSSIHGVSSLGMVMDAKNVQIQQGSSIVTATVTPLGIAGGNGDAVDNDGDKNTGMGRVVSKDDVSGIGSMTAAGYKNELQGMDNAKKL
jgi:hypothetical protein